MAMRVPGAVLLVLLLSGCRGGGGTRCDRICRSEADCAERLDQPDVDRASCVEACVELERDPRTQKVVDDHAHCVVNARECVDLLNCP